MQISSFFAAIFHGRDSDHSLAHCVAVKCPAGRITLPGRVLIHLKTVSDLLSRERVGSFTLDITSILFDSVQQLDHIRRECFFVVQFTRFDIN